MARLRVIEGERSEAPESSETPEPRTGFALFLHGQPYWRRVMLLEAFSALYIARRREELKAEAEAAADPDSGPPAPRA